MVLPQSGDSRTTSTDQTSVRQFLERYVHQLKAQGAIRSSAVEQAFHTVERHRLLQSFYRPPGPGRPTNSQPSLVAEMLELLDLAPGLNVLEIGAGTGYNAALMAELVGDQHLVVTLDVLEDVVKQTRRLLARTGYPEIAVLWRNGVQGAAERAPFDRIVATVGCSDLSPRWAEQLATWPAADQRESTTEDVQPPHDGPWTCCLRGH